MTALRKWGPWGVLVAIAVIVLALGVHRSSHPDLDARVQSVASQVRCPVCDGETVAQSQAAPSVEIRNQIREDLQSGESQAQILSGLVKAYGPGILEKPQASGVSLFVWVIPVVAVMAGAGGLVLVLRRWRSGPEWPAPDPDFDLDPEPLAPAVVGSELGPTLATRSVAEPVGESTAPRTVATTELPNEDTVRTPRGGRSGARPGSRRPGLGAGWSRRTRWAVTGVGMALVTGGASWAVVASSGTRLPGQSITGQALPAEVVAAHLQAAASDAQKGDAFSALKEYESVLQAEPNQVDALTGMGWLLAQTGQPSLLQKGLGQLSAAERADPSYALAHLYRGMALLGEGDYGASVPELQWYLDHGPDPQLTANVRQALAKAQAGLAAGSGAAGAGAAGSSGAADGAAAGAAS